MHRSTLHEMAKFATGLVAGDFLAGLWTLNSGLLPRVFFGIEFTAPLVWLWMGFDAFLILILVHYAWHPKSLEPHMANQSLLFAVGILTGAVALAHFIRLVFGLQVVIGSWIAPMWLSWAGLIVTAFISYSSFHLASRK